MRAGKKLGTSKRIKKKRNERVSPQPEKAKAQEHSTASKTKSSRRGEAQISTKKSQLDKKEKRERIQEFLVGRGTSREENVRSLKFWGRRGRIRGGSSEGLGKKSKHINRNCM